MRNSEQKYNLPNALLSKIRNLFAQLGGFPIHANEKKWTESIREFLSAAELSLIIDPTA